MQLDCPHCGQTLEFSTKRPSFCAYCGQAITQTDPDATIVRNEGWFFIQCGRYLERADKTSRILDVRHDSLPAQGTPANPSQADALGWSAVLRSCR